MSTSKESYAFKKELEELGSIKGQGTELISLYIPYDFDRSSISSKLTDELSQSSNIKSKTTKKNVQGALEKIIHYLKTVNYQIPKHGVAIFCGSFSRETGGHKIQLLTVVPPKEINIQLYRCDSMFFLDPLKEMTASDEVYGIVVMDKHEATVALLSGKKLDIIKNMVSQVPGKTRAGGQSAQRFERLREVAENEFYKRIADIANSSFSELKNLRGIIFGGPGSTKNHFLNEDYLQTRVKEKVIADMSTGYTDESGIREVVNKSGEIIENAEIVQEKKLMDRFFENIARGERSTYGEKEVREAVLEGRVEILLISEAVKMKRIKLFCGSCEKSKELTVKDFKTFRENIPKCECGATFEIVEAKDLYEELSELAEQIGSGVEIISAETDIGKQFMIAFGGLGAILRF